MALCCATPAILIVAFLLLFKVKSSYLIWLAVLLCPVLHIWMMKGRGHKKSGLYECKECGLLYEEEEWVDKCEAWCREHKTCNVEIMKHAVK